VRYTKIYIYFGLKLFLLAMGWIIFYQLKLMKYYTEFVDFPEQVYPSFNRVIISISILLIISFLILTVLTWKEFIRLNAKNTISADQKCGSDSLKSHKEKPSTKANDQTSEESVKNIYEVKRQKLISCIEKDVTSYSGNSEKIIGKKILSCISKVYELTQAEIFLKAGNAEKKTTFRLLAAFAIPVCDNDPAEFDLGEGLIGQVAQYGKHHYIDELPEGYLNVRSGLGQSDPGCLLIFPWKDRKGKTFAVVELASFRPFSQQDIKLLESISENLIPLFNLD